MGCSGFFGESGSGKGDDCYGYKGGCYERGSVEDLVVGDVAGVMEEEVVLDAHVGDDGHGDLDVAALVCGGKDVEGCQAEA